MDYTTNNHKFTKGITLRIFKIYTENIPNYTIQAREKMNEYEGLACLINKSIRVELHNLQINWPEESHK